MRNVGSNQLLDSSMSLSLLYRASTRKFARYHRVGPPPRFPLASPSPGIAHHLSGGSPRAPAQPRAVSCDTSKSCRPALPPCYRIRASYAGYFHCAAGGRAPSACTRVALLGPCYKTGRRRRRRAGAFFRIASAGSGESWQCVRRPFPERKELQAHAACRRPHQPLLRLFLAKENSRPLRFALRDFKASFTHMPVCLSPVTRATCSLSVSGRYSAEGGLHLPLCAALPSSATRRAPTERTLRPRPRGSHPPRRSLPRHLPRRNAPCRRPKDTCRSLAKAIFILGLARFTRSYWGRHGYCPVLRALRCFNSAGCRA